LISFVIPAHNEEALLGKAIASIRESAKAAGEPYEIIVVNDASTDGTANVAVQNEAVLVNVELRRISAVRNAGARCAKGDVLIFVDADTELPPPTRGCLQCCGSVEPEARLGRGSKLSNLWTADLRMWNEISRVVRWAAGCFVFVRRDVFDAVGGFDETYFVGEEIILSSALKRKGRFVVLRQPVITSARKVHLYGKLEMMWLLTRMSIQGQQSWRKRDGLDMWYARRDLSNGSSYLARRGACIDNSVGTRILILA
jgi:GT2 family glycosyltransferase